MKKSKRGWVKQNIPERRLSQGTPGSSPGSFQVGLDALDTTILVTSYSLEVLNQQKCNSLSQLQTHLNNNSQCTHWIDIRGLGNLDLLHELTAFFKISKLELEDVVSGNHRPKLEEHQDHIFIVSRIITITDDLVIRNKQLSIFASENYVITMGEDYENNFVPLYNRLAKTSGRMRTMGPAYMSYAIIDNEIDFYFPVLEKIAARLEDIEEQIINNSSRQSMEQLQKVKRQLIVFKREAFAERDKINDILRTPLDLYDHNLKVYLRDTYDHIVQILDEIDSCREIADGLMDIYLSIVNTKTNQVMKVLAVFSALFLPLTFIVGIYGMNFSPVNPHTNEHMPYNMPELYLPYGYVIIMGVTVLIVAVQLFIFWRKGWLGSS